MCHHLSPTRADLLLPIGELVFDASEVQLELAAIVTVLAPVSRGPAGE